MRSKVVNLFLRMRPRRRGILTVLGAFLLLTGLTMSKGQPVPHVAFNQMHSSRRPANARSCAECHSSPTTGGSSRRTVMRAGSFVGGKYIAIRDGGILHTIDYDASARGATMYGARVTPNLLGDGYVEAVRDEELQAIANQQVAASHGKIHGEVVYLTPPNDSNDGKFIGRFGWKAQHASLLDASADALLNELGVPNPIFPGNSNTSAERGNARQHPSATAADELKELVQFVRSTEPIAPDPVRSTAEGAQAGSKIFDRIGCSLCHVRTLKTAPPGTRLRSSGIVVSARLGNKEIHPFSDYLLHDIGTGDGIVQNVRPEDYARSTANKFRTAPLWGVRFRLWMMHDGKSLTYHQAIMRHRGEALDVTENYAHLTPTEQEQLRLFLDSL